MMTPMEAALYMTRGQEDRAERVRLFADMVACFPAYGILRGGAILVQNEKHPYGDMWFLSDNGGEINAGRVNVEGSHRDAPYDTNKGMLDGATLAYRIRCFLNDTPIDYSRDHSDLLDDLKEFGARAAS